MYKLKTEKRIQIVACLVEGMSVRATCRMTGAAKGTVLSLLVDLGRVCADFHDKNVRGLKPDRVECDEIWAFNYCKQRNVRTAKSIVYGAGDAYTWVAIDRDSKLIISYLVGQRSGADAAVFMDDLSGRVINIGTLTSDGFNAYPDAVKAAFGDCVDYAQLIKHYKATQSASDTRYSPATCTGCTKQSVIGFPEASSISTSILERQNMTMRMSMRRFTRLTNGFSKKFANLQAAVAIHFLHYNYARKHSTLKGKTPAMAVGLANRVWSIADILSLLDSEGLN